MDTYRRDNEYQEPDELMIPSQGGFIIIPTNTIRVKESSDQRVDNNDSRWNSYKLKNILQFTLMLTGMIALLAYVGFTIEGMVGFFVISAVAGIGFTTISSNRIEKRL